MKNKELEQKAILAFGDNNVTEFARAIAQPYFISNNAPIDGVYVRAEAALEALQLKQNIIDRLQNQRKFDNDLIVEKDKTIASLQKRCGRLEAMLLNCKKTLRMWEPDYPSDEEKQLQRDLWRLEQALTETKGGEA